MKIKILLAVFILAMAGGSVTVPVVQSRKEHLRRSQEGQLPAAISNYNRAFKLNTSPPLWPESPAKGGAHGNTTN